MNIVTFQTITDVAALIEDDCVDTINKVSTIYPIFSALLAHDHLDIMSELQASDIDSIEDFSIVLSDGDLLRVERTNDASSYTLSAVKINSDGVRELQVPLLTVYTSDTTDESGTIQYHTGDIVCALLSTEQAIPSINGDSWNIIEIVQSITDTYAQNEVVRRATSLLNNNNLTVDSFSTLCNELLTGASVNTRRLYSNVLETVSSANAAATIEVLKSQYMSIDGAEVNNDSIDFANTSYYVQGFNGTVAFGAFTTVAQVLGGIIAAIQPIIGLVISGIGSILNAISNAAMTAAGANATINHGSAFRLFAQPILQAKINKGAFSFLDQALINSKVVKFIRPEFVLFAWIDDANINTYNLEAYLNVDITPLYGLGSRFKTESSNVLSNYFGLLKDSQIDGVSYDGWSDNRCTSSFSVYDDNTALKAVSTSLSYFACLLNGGSMPIEADSPTSFQILPRTSISSVSNSQRTMTEYLNQVAYLTYSGSAPTWENIVNTIVPTMLNTEVDSDTTWSNSEWLKYRLCRILENLSNYPGTYLTIKSMSPIADYYIVPPTLSKVGFWLSLATSAAIATAAVATVVGTKYLVSKKVGNILANKREKVEQLRKTWLQDTNNQDAYNSYYHSLRTYNIMASMSGESTLSVATGNVSIGQALDDAQLSIDQNQKGFSKIIELIH